MIVSGTRHWEKALVRRNASIYTGLLTGDGKDWLPQSVCMRLEGRVKELILIY